MRSTQTDASARQGRPCVHLRLVLVELVSRSNFNAARVSCSRAYHTHYIPRNPSARQINAILKSQLFKGAKISY